MPDPTVIPTINAFNVDIPRVAVWTAPRLSPAEWVRQPYLFLTTVTRAAAPQVDQAEFYFDYGPVFREGSTEFDAFDQLDLIGQFVKVVITDADGLELLKWFGIIEIEENDVRGLSARTDAISTGRQVFVAFGLLRLLERVFLRSTTKFRDETETEPITIERGIPFNLSDRVEFPEAGNRSVELSDGVYLFSDAPELSDEWTAWTAAEYLLKHHVPIDGNDNPLCEWELDGPQEALDWYIIHTRTEGRSVKEILDELISIKRCVGYYPVYDEDENKVQLKLFTLNSEDLVLPDPSEPGETITIPANPDQRSLDFERAVTITSARLRNVITTRYHEVVARGEPRTSTGTFRFNSQWAEFDKAWSTGQETAYLEAGSLKDGYDDLEKIDKAELNAVVRSDDKLRAVFRRFQLTNEWNMRQPVLFFQDDEREFNVFPKLIGNGGSTDNTDAEADTIQEFDEGSDINGETVWIRDLTILQKLALRYGLDYSGDRVQTGEYLEGDELLLGDNRQSLRPMFFMRFPSTGKYHFLEHLFLTTAFETDNRSWGVAAEILPTGPVLDLNVVGGPQQFIAADFWDDAAATDPEHDPAKNGGVNYEDIYATLTVAHDSRAEIRRVIEIVQTGVQKRVLYIDVPDARLDYLVPYTVIGLDKDGVVQSESGGLIRDDRQRLKTIAVSAAEWYGKVRQTLDVSFRRISPVVEIGSLIIELPSDYQREDVNTVVTRITYNLANPRDAFTQFETSFAEFDLV